MDPISTMAQFTSRRIDQWAEKLFSWQTKTFYYFLMWCKLLGFWLQESKQNLPDLSLSSKRCPALLIERSCRDVPVPGPAGIFNCWPHPRDPPLLLACHPDVAPPPPSVSFLPDEVATSPITPHRQELHCSRIRFQRSQRVLPKNVQFLCLICRHSLCYTIVN